MGAPCGWRADSWLGKLAQVGFVVYLDKKHLEPIGHKLAQVAFCANTNLNQPEPVYVNMGKNSESQKSMPLSAKMQHFH